MKKKKNSSSSATDAIPLLEFDPERNAIIEPSKIVKHRDMPECFVCRSPGIEEG